MPSRIPVSMRSRLFSTTTRPRAALPSNIHTYHAAAAPLIAATAQPTPKLGRTAKWYLPAMAAIAVGMMFIPEDLFDEPTKRTVTLGEANRRIDFGIAHQLDEHNRRANQGYQPSLEERNWAMLDSYGGRSCLEDIEKVLAGYEESHKPMGKYERNLMMEDAYGDRSDLRHLRRAMEIYEVQ